MKKRMIARIALTLTLIVGITAWAWALKRLPLVSGEVSTLTIWDGPDGRSDGYIIGSNRPGCWVDVYDGIIVVTTPDGDRFVRPNGTYSNLKLKP